MKKLISATLIAGLLALTPVGAEADTSGGQAIPASCSAPSTSASSGSNGTLTVDCSVGTTRTAAGARRADANDGRLRIKVWLKQDGKIKQKFVMFRRVTVGKTYNVQTWTLKYPGTYRVKLGFRPDKGTRFAKSITYTKIRVS
ncbi:hypothetical protein GCM10022215_04090 [Nocardioides fonticola]|uniref:Ig-like domain-containing protein n=1 Tax=Nocardioides fonticola TaxID=450363 RepID=A0ABP7XAP1_9ACTN